MALDAGIGAPLSRIDGALKVSGRARYAAEHPTQDLLHGAVVASVIAKGRISLIDTAAAMAVPGIIEVITHENRPHVAWLDRSYNDEVRPPGSPFRALYDEKIYFSQQPVALVVAETPELARYAARLVHVEYDEEESVTDLDTTLAKRFTPRKQSGHIAGLKNRGDAEGALMNSAARVSEDYKIPYEHHNPMEMFATTVIRDGNGQYTVYDKTQGSQNVQTYLSNVFDVKPDDVRVRNPFVGGAFGSALRPKYQVYLAMMAAVMLQRSVRVALTRQQMFVLGYRPSCVQNVSLATGKDGKLSALVNKATAATSRYENYTENIVNWAGSLYACDNASFDSGVVALDLPTPCDMRAPGAATGMNLFEIAMDEMAFAADIDPLQFRIINYSDVDAMHGSPYTSKALMAAYLEGAREFGWDQRSKAPRSMKDGRELVGWGMATGMWEALMVPATARATLRDDGRLEIASATSDIGTGTYTIMAQIAAEELGLPLDQIIVRLGDSSLPTAPVQGGSFTASSVGAAVQMACRSIAERLLKEAGKMTGQPLGPVTMDQVEFADGWILVKGDRSRAVRHSDVVRASGEQVFEAEQTAKPAIFSNLRKSRHTHCATFVEVKVDEELGVVRVPRVVCAVAAGRILNPKTARSQIIGGVVMGIGMALHEESVLDHRIGRFMNHNFADYHVPAHADIQDIDVIFVDEPDSEVSPLGIKGVGEIGTVGVAAAVANAIFHATGKRVRELPITIDKIM